MSTLLLPSSSQAVPGSVLMVESSNPKLDPDELPADTFPLLLPARSDDEGAAATVVVAATGEAIVLGIFEGCVSQSSASCVNS